MKGKSILVASLIFITLQFVLLFPIGVRTLVRWENRMLGGSYIKGALMVSLGIFVIILNNYEFPMMGVYTENWRLSVNYGIRGYFFFLIPQLILSLLQLWGISYQDFFAISVILGCLVLTMSYFMFRKGKLLPASNRRLIIAGLILLSPLVLGLYKNVLSIRTLKEFTWNIFIGGFAEEFFYRGYIQSSVNLEYGKKWRIGNTSFGTGLLVSALLYGLGRGLGTIKPWIGLYQVSWSRGLYAFTVGIFYGLIREASDDIISSGTANSMIDAVGEAVKRVYF
jgi:membrane protease YdiL (CAAX protease family)